MNIPPQYAVGCEELIQETQHNIKNSLFFKDEYNRVVTCVVRNKCVLAPTVN